MRIILLFILMIPVIGFSQVKWKVKAGTGFSSAHVKNGGQNYWASEAEGHQAWFAGAEVSKRNIKSWIFTTGAEIKKQPFYLMRVHDFYSFKGEYKPVYLNVPISVGYQISISKKISCTPATGVYYELGVGGSAEVQTVNTISSMWIPEHYEKSSIRYARKNDSKPGYVLAPHGIGFRAGSSFTFGRRLSVSAEYERRLSNVLPRRENVVERFTYSNVRISIGYAIK